MHAPTGDVQRVVLQVQQSVQRAVGLDPHIATAATIAAGWPTAGHELLATKSRYAVAAIPALHPNLCPIDEHLSTACLAVNRRTACVSGRVIQIFKSQISDSKFQISKFQIQKTKCAPGVPEGRRAAHSIDSIEQFFA
jgi:hypothetical protein